MHRISIVFLLAATCSGISVPASAQWTQLNGPEPPVVSALETDGSTILLGTNESDAGELFRSTDGGHTWANAGFPNGGIGELLVDGSNWFLGSYIDGTYRSTDGGFTWTKVDPGVTADVVLRLGANLFSGESFFTARPIRRSTDDGATWAAIPGSPSVRILSMVSDGSRIFLGSGDSGMYRSTDGGTTWHQLTGGLPSTAKISSIAPLNGDLFCGLLSGVPLLFGVFRSTDDGETWTQTAQSPVSNAGTEIHRLVAHDGALYAGTRSFTTGGLYRSTDLGATWEDLDQNLPGNHNVGDFLWLDGGATLLAGLDDGLYRTEDDTQTWTETRHGTGAIRGSQCVIDRQGTLVVGLQTNAAQGRGIWRTTDLGDTWLPSSGTGATATSRALCDLGAEVLAGFYNTSPRGVFRSTDGGAWALSSNGIATSTIINEIYDDAGTIWAGAWEALYRSTDNGFHWQTSGGIGRAQSILRVGNRLLVGTDAGIQSTTDGGETWSSFSTGLPGSIVETMASVQGTAFAAIWGFGIYRLEGETWVPTSIDDDYYEVLQSVGPVLVTQSVLGYDILYSLDLGETWSTFNDGFFGGEIYTMTISDGHLVAGTRGRGFWARPLSDLPGAADVPSPEPSTAANEMHLQLWPNPTKDGGTFAFALPQAGRVRLTLYDVSGRALLVLADERMSAGEHRARMESGDLSRLPAAGAVFARLELDGTVLATTKLARLP